MANVAELHPRTDPVIVTTESQLERIIDRAVARALQHQNAVLPPEDDLIGIDEAMKLIPGVSKDWMYRNAAKLKIGRKLSYKKLVFSKTAILLYTRGHYGRTSV